MVAKVKDLIEMESGKKYMVDDVKVVDGKEYVVLYDLDTGNFLIATEQVVNKKPNYYFLEMEEAIEIAGKIDKIDHK